MSSAEAAFVKLAQPTALRSDGAMTSEDEAATLVALAGHPDPRMRRNIADHPNVTSETLDRLAFVRNIYR